MDPKPNASYGALISIILILAIVIVGAIYVGGSRAKQNGQVIELPPMTSTTTEATTTLSATTTPR
jgi:hypothetical protein